MAQQKKVKVDGYERVTRKPGAPKSVLVTAVKPYTRAKPKPSK